MQSKVISIGHNHLLLGIRNQLFSRAGYAVFSTTNSSEALTLASFCDIVVLGHTIPFDERIELASRIRAEFPNLPIVAMCNVCDPCPVTSAYRCLYGFQPQELLNA